MGPGAWSREKGAVRRSCPDRPVTTRHDHLLLLATLSAPSGPSTLWTGRVRARQVATDGGGPLGCAGAGGDHAAAHRREPVDRIRSAGVYARSVPPDAGRVTRESRRSVDTR